MAIRPHNLVQQVQLAILRDVDALTDGELLVRFREHRDGDAFAAIIRRHGPMVWGVCRRALDDRQDLEDAFQATFLVLVRRAESLRETDVLGSWLHGVARRTATKARNHRTKWRRRFGAVVDGVEAVSSLDPAAGERRIDLDAALCQLPDRYRLAIVLCDLEERTRAEVSRQFGVPEGTVSGWLMRGRALLARRLSSHGPPMASVAVAALLAKASAEAAPPMAALQLASALGRAEGSLWVSYEVVSLARKVANAMIISKLKIVSVTVLIMAIAGGSLGAMLKKPRTQTPLAGPVAADPPVPPVAEPALPVGAVRIGSTDFRVTAGWHKKVFFTADGAALVAPLENKTVEIWDPITGRRLHEIAIPKSHFRDSDYHAAGHLLAIFGWRTQVDSKPSENVVWFVDTKARQVLREFVIPEADHSVGHVIRFTPDGKRLILTFDREIRVLDIKTGEEVIRQKHKGGSQAVSLSPNGKTIAFGDYELYLWDWESGEEPRKFASGGSAGAQVSVFTGDGKSLIVVGRVDGKARTFDVATGRETGSFELNGYQRSWSLSPDGKTLAASGRDAEKTGQAVVLYDPATGKVRNRLSIGRDEMSNATWSPDGTRLAAVNSYRLWTWDVKTMKPLGTPAPGHEGIITAFAFGPDGRLFTASDDHTIRSWDVKTGKPGLTLTHDHWVRDVAVSPDGTLVAGSSLRNDLRIWDAKTGAERFKLLGNGSMGGMRKVRFTPDGKRLVAWGDDLYLRVWNTENGKLLAEHRTLPDGITEETLANDRMGMKHLGLILAVISDDGSTFALCGNRFVQIFDVETGKERAKFEGDPNGVDSLAFSPDGKRMAIAGNAKRVEIRLEGGGTRGTSENDHRIAVWDLAEKKSLWNLVSQGSGACEVHFSPDGSRLAERVSVKDSIFTIFFRDAKNGKDQGRIELPNRSWYFAFDPTGKKIAVSNADTTATLYDLETAIKPKSPK